MVEKKMDNYSGPETPATVVVDKKSVSGQGIPTTLAIKTGQVQRQWKRTQATGRWQRILGSWKSQIFKLVEMCAEIASQPLRSATQRQRSG